MLPCLDVIKEYLGLIFTFPDVVQIHRGASSKVHDCDKMKEEGRIDVSQWRLLSLCVRSMHICTWITVHLLAVDCIITTNFIVPYKNTCSIGCGWSSCGLGFQS